MTEFPAHGEDGHICVTGKPGVIHRHMIPNFMVVSHRCGEKPHFRYLASLPPAPKIAPTKRKRARRMA